MKYLLPVLLAGLSAAADNTVCNANNCLRAVRNTQFPTRGSTDCAAYQVTTVTPSLQTVTATVTQTTTPTSVIGVTFTTVIPVTATVTESVSYTATDEETAIDTIYSTVTVHPPAKRAVTTASIPAYASPCSSAAAYLSACKCIGVTASTVTAATPTTTTTVTATVTPITATAYTTLLTQTQLTTSTTETVFTTVATVTVTNTVATLTESATATYTPPLPSVFYLKGPNDGSTVSGQYIEDFYSLAHFTTGSSTAIKWTIINGYLTRLGDTSPAGYPGNVKHSFVLTADGSSGDPKLSCQIDYATGLQCDVPFEVCYNNDGVKNFLAASMPTATTDFYYACNNPYPITLTFEDAS